MGLLNVRIILNPVSPFFEFMSSFYEMFPSLIKLLILMTFGVFVIIALLKVFTR